MQKPLGIYVLTEIYTFNEKNNWASKKYYFWFVFLTAVATHKYVMSFCVGLELYMAKTRMVIYCSYLFVYAIMSPIGIGIGYAIIGDNSDQTQSLDDPAFNVIVAVLQALAGGTILYVVAFEILERERSKSVSGLVQLAFVIIGFSVLMAVELLGMNI